MFKQFNSSTQCSSTIQFNWTAEFKTTRLQRHADLRAVPPKGPEKQGSDQPTCIESFKLNVGFNPVVETN